MAEVKHSFTSPKADGPDTTRVRPSDWNAAHALSADLVTAASQSHVREHSMTGTGDHAAAAAGDRGRFLRADPTTGEPIWDTPGSGAFVSGPASSVMSNIVMFTASNGKSVGDSGIAASDVVSSIGLAHARQHALDSALDHSVPLGPLNMNSQNIQNVLDPVLEQDAATKAYVDAFIAFSAYFFATNDASAVGAGYYKLFDYDPGTALSTLTVTPTGVDQKLFTYIMEAGHPNSAELFHGIYSFHFHAKVTATAGKKTARLYCKIGERTAGGVETVRLTTEVTGDLTAAYQALEVHGPLAADVAINTTDRVFVEVWAQCSGAAPAYPEVNVQQEGVTTTGLSMPTVQAYIDANYLRRDGTLPMLGDLDMGGTYKIRRIAVPASQGDALRRTPTVTEAALERLVGDYDTIGCVIGDGVSVVTSGSKLYRPIGHDCTIKAWEIVAQSSGSLVVDVKRGTYAGFPTMSSIAGSQRPTLTAQQKNTLSNLSAWATGLQLGHWLEFTWGNGTSVKRCTVVLFVSRT